jgi:hypothetical protein
VGGMARATPGWPDVKETSTAVIASVRNEITESLPNPAERGKTSELCHNILRQSLFLRLNLINRKTVNIHTDLCVSLLYIQRD